MSTLPNIAYPQPWLFERGDDCSPIPADEKAACEAVSALYDEHAVGFMNLHARQIAGLPEEWSWYKWEAVGDPGKPGGGVLVTGAVCAEVFEKGKRKGHKNWKKLDKSTERTVIITDAGLQDFRLAWEASTGRCHECYGVGLVWWTVGVEGTRYQTCKRCEGSGNAPISTSERAA